MMHATYGIDMDRMDMIDQIKKGTVIRDQLGTIRTVLAVKTYKHRGGQKDFLFEDADGKKFLLAHYNIEEIV